MAMPNEGGFKFTIKILVLQGKTDENSIKFRVKGEIACSGFRNIYKYMYTNHLNKIGPLAGPDTIKCKKSWTKNDQASIFLFRKYYVVTYFERGTFSIQLIIKARNSKSLLLN